MFTTKLYFPPFVPDNSSSPSGAAAKFFPDRNIGAIHGSIPALAPTFVQRGSTQFQPLSCSKCKIKFASIDDQIHHITIAHLTVSPKSEDQIKAAEKNSESKTFQCIKCQKVRPASKILDQFFSSNVKNR